VIVRPKGGMRLGSIRLQATHGRKAQMLPHLMESVMREREPQHARRNLHPRKRSPEPEPQYRESEPQHRVRRTMAAVVAALR